MPNTILKRWNGTAFEELYPKTTVGQISATGTPSSTTFLRGDGQWQIPATQSHSHGNISNAGGWNNSPITPANADTIPLTRSGLISNSNLTIGTSTTTFLRNDGTWATPAGGGGTDPWSYVYLTTSTARQDTTYTTFLTSSTLDANSYYEFISNILIYKTTTGISVRPEYAIILNNTTGTPTLQLSGFTTLPTGNLSGLQITLAATANGSGNTITNATATTSAYNRLITMSGIIYTGTSTKTISLQDRTNTALTGGDFVGSSVGSFIRVRKIN